MAEEVFVIGAFIGLRRVTFGSLSSLEQTGASAFANTGLEGVSLSWVVRASIGAVGHFGPHHRFSGLACHV